MVKIVGHAILFFRLENGKCIFIYSFEAIYKITQNNEVNEKTKLFNIDSLNDYEINKIQIDGDYFETKENYYKFKKEGEHKVRINIDIKDSSSLEKFFENINELKSINFTNDFNTSAVENMKEMFSSSKNLISIKFISFKNLLLLFLLLFLHRYPFYFLFHNKLNIFYSD